MAIHSHIGLTHWNMDGYDMLFMSIIIILIYLNIIFGYWKVMMIGLSAHYVNIINTVISFRQEIV